MSTPPPVPLSLCLAEPMLGGHLLLMPPLKLFSEKKRAPWAKGNDRDGLYSTTVCMVDRGCSAAGCGAGGWWRRLGRDGV